MKLLPGAHVTGNVKLLRPLGEGGMGAVWVAQHLALGTEVAVKFLQGDVSSDPAMRSRFSREAAAASQVKSAHVVRIYDYGITETNVPFIVMEMLEGTDLSHRILTEHKLAPAEVVPIVSQLCKALASAHAQNVVHRDVKPANVFLTHEGGDVFVKLLDFGVAKADKLGELDSRRSTMANESLGTPYYMSPEQFRSAKASDPRSDVWSVGVLVYEALTGKLPFEGETIGALAIAVNDAKPVPPCQVEPSLPPAFDGWFAKACAREPNDRFQTARELSDALAAVFAMAPSTAALDSGSHRRIVISHIDPRELADAERISMRETSFATSSQSLPNKSHARTIVIAAVIGCGAIGAAFFVLHRSPAPPAPTREQPATIAASSNVTNADPSATAEPIPVVSFGAASDPPKAKNVTKTSTTPAPRPSASIKTQGAASAKGAHGDIW